MLEEGRRSSSFSGRQEGQRRRPAQHPAERPIQTVRGKDMGPKLKIKTKKHQGGRRARPQIGWPDESGFEIPGGEEERGNGGAARIQVGSKSMRGRRGRRGVMVRTHGAAGEGRCGGGGGVPGRSTGVCASLLRGCGWLPSSATGGSPLPVGGEERRLVSDSNQHAPSEQPSARHLLGLARATPTHIVQKKENPVIRNRLDFKHVIPNVFS